MSGPVLLIACGALAKEIVALRRLNHWTHLSIRCLPAELHNRPEKIPQAVQAEIEDNRESFEHIFVAYADCGTGGMLDRVLRKYGIERLSGAHCYEFFAGSREFDQLAEAEAGTFYLTDFLTRHFDRLVVRGLGLDRHPELLGSYFGNYRKLVYLSQSESEDLAAMAERHASFLGLEYEHIHTGLTKLARQVEERIVRWQN